MLHRFCSATLLLMVAGCVPCLSDTFCLESVCEFHSELDGERYKTRAALSIIETIFLYPVAGFTSETVNSEGTVVSRVNGTLIPPSFSYSWKELEQRFSWIAKTPFVEDFWLGDWSGITHLSVQVYNMSMKQTIVSKLRGYHLEELELTGNSWTTIRDLTLKAKHLKKLSLPDNQIEELYRGFMDDFPSLEVLDLSRNNIARFDRNLAYLIWGRRERMTISSRYWFCIITRNLKKINLSYNQITSVGFSVIAINTELDLSFNNITALENRRYFIRANGVVLAGQNISSLSQVGTILSNDGSQLLEFSVSYVELLYANECLERSVYVIQSVCSLNKMNILCSEDSSNIYPREGRSIVNLTGNQIEIDGSFVFEIWPINHLDLSKNNLEVLMEDLPRQISDIKQLSLSRNSIGYIGRHFFQNMTRLTVLDLSHNNLKYVQLILYSSLIILDISNNYLNRMDISHNSSNFITTYLNLSHNSFTNILEVEWSQFKQFSKVDLGQNNLQCCGPEGHYSRTMLLHYHDNILNINSTKPLSCVMPYNGRAEMTNEWLREDHCQNHVQGWVVFGCLLFLTPLLIHAVELLHYYIHQTERDLAHHLTRLKKQGLEQDESHAQECQYDAFVCHSHKDVRWVRHRLVPNLENERDGHKLCIHYRDFPLGSLIEENIETAMNTSRKVIVVVTRAFLQSYWCKMELTFAWTKMVNEGRNYIIVVELDRIPKEKRPPILCYLMQSRTYLEWPEEPTDVVKQDCWRRMRDALGKSLRDRQQQELKRARLRNRRRNEAIVIETEC